MSLLGKIIKLHGITQKGKNRVREHGNEWTVFAETERVLFSPDKKGPWLFIAPIGQTQDSKASRWVHQNNDPDFKLVIPVD
jgi:hypothetical protein